MRIAGIAKRSRARQILPMTDQQSEPPLRVGIIPVTPLEQNCTLLWCTKTMRGALCDVGGDLDKVRAVVAKVGVTIEKLLVNQEAQKLARADGEARLAALQSGTDKLAWGADKVVSRMDARLLPPQAAPLVPLHAVKPLIAGSAAWNSLAPALFGFG